MRWFLTAAVLCSMAGEATMAADWPQFRGPQGDGHAQASGLPATWGGFSEPPAWQTPIAGTGWSSPVVVGDRIWLTSAEETARSVTGEAQKQVQGREGTEGFQMPASVSLLAIELDASGGRILRRLELFTCQDPVDCGL